LVRVIEIFVRVTTNITTENRICIDSINLMAITTATGIPIENGVIMATRLMAIMIGETGRAANIHQSIGID